MDLRTTGMEFASEMVIKANLFKMKIAEVPTILSKDGRSRPPHLRPWRDGWRHLRFMLLFSPRWLFLIPGLFLLAVSSILYSLILAGPVQIYRLFLDIHTLFYMQAAITIALTALLLGITARMFGMREGLLQEHRLLKKLRSTPILEIGGLIGIICAGIGLYLGVDLLTAWGNKGFGGLEYGMLLRSVSLSTLLISVGGIVFLSSLMMGFLALPTRRSPE
jgi:hypothetical protein